MISPESLRQDLLAQAGVTPDRQAKLLSKTVEGIERDLDAEERKVLVTKDGDVIERDVPDNTARAKARDQALNLVGANAPRSNATQTVRHVVEIEWPDYAKPIAIPNEKYAATVVDVTPEPAK